MTARRRDASRASPVPPPSDAGQAGARSPAAAVALREGPQGVYVKVTARPGTGADRLMGVQGDALKLGVSAAPEKGKATKAVGELLASILGVRKSAVTLSTGETSREKSFHVEGVDAARARAAITKALTEL